MNPVTDLYLQPHLGLGDAIICCGLVRKLALRHDRVIWPCRWNNYPSVAFMFSDLANVSVLGVDDDNESKLWAENFSKGRTQVIRMGIHSGKCDFNRWDKQFYEQCSIPFEQRWDGFAIPPLGVSGEGEAILVHDDASRGYCIRDELVPPGARRMPVMPTIFHLVPWLQTAPEIHVIDSCVLCLADSIKTSANRLVYHKYAKPSWPPTLRKTWSVLS